MSELKIYVPGEPLPTIHLVYNSMKYYELFIDGKKVNFIFGSSKKFMTRYLKRTYGDSNTHAIFSRNDLH